MVLQCRDAATATAKRRGFIQFRAIIKGFVSPFVEFFVTDRPGALPPSSVRNRKSASSLAPIGASTRAFPLLTGLSAHAVHWTACVSAPRLGPRALRTLLIWFDNLWMHLRMYEHCPIGETVLTLAIHGEGAGGEVWAAE